MVYFFYLIVLCFLIASLGVVLSKNPIHSVFYLILIFFLGSLLFFSVGLEFFAIMFLVIYVGAIAVLFLFIIMMLNVKIIELRVSYYVYLPVTLFFLLFIVLELNFFLGGGFAGIEVFYFFNVVYIDWFLYFQNLSILEKIGFVLYNEFCFLFFFCALLLFLATFASISLTIGTKKNNVKHQDVELQWLVAYDDRVRLFRRSNFLFFFMFNFKVNIFSFQSPATPVMEGIIDFHNYVFFYLILVFIFVVWMFGYIIYNFYIVPTLFYDVKKGFSGLFFLVLRSEIIDEYFLKSKIIRWYVYSVEFIVGFLTKQKIKPGFFDFSSVLSNLSRVRHLEILHTRYVTEFFFLELIWTIIPEVILVFIAVPSLGLLYAMDEVYYPAVTIKVIGYQWFWSYEYHKVVEMIKFNYLQDSLGYNVYVFKGGKIFDSVMIPESDLKQGRHRLLEVDNKIIVPVYTHVRMEITAADVLHSWAVPAFGVKVDAIPGRMSQVGIFIKRPGVFYGQCSELCGVNHGFMPIVVKAVSYKEFLRWYWTPKIVWNSDFVQVL